MVRKTTKQKAAPARVDVVFIRKSTKGQNEQPQIANVKNMLKDEGIHVPEELWFVGTVKRRKVRGNEQFNRLIELVEQDRVSRVCIETQDRWGTRDRVELFALLGLFRDHDTQLYDLHHKIDLADPSMVNEFHAILGSMKSEAELKDLANRSMRSKINRFKDLGTWPTGTQPFGFGKACHSQDGELLWIWYPVTRTRGQQFFPDPKGKLTPGPANKPLPRKTKYDTIKLVPTNDVTHRETIRLVFEYYAVAGMSRRQIAKRLNTEGRRFYRQDFSHTLVTQMLRNPAYVGDTHYGKTQSAELKTFDAAKCVVVDVKKANGKRVRPVAERLVKENTHEPLIDRKTWELAQKKLTSETERPSFAPRNPAYYLKQIFVCGHCGKNVTGRRDHKTGEVEYVCRTYIANHAKGTPKTCGFHRITHADAEKMLLDKIKEMNLQFDESRIDKKRLGVEARLKQLGHDDEAQEQQWSDWLFEGTGALANYLESEFGDDDQNADRRFKAFRRLRSLANDYYCGTKLTAADFEKLPFKLAEFKEAVRDAEQAAVESARERLRKIESKHAKLTVSWADASEQMRVVLKKEIDRLEQQITKIRPRTKTVSERLEVLYQAEAEQQALRDRIAAELPALESREKGEAFRRVFDTVTLFWTATHHPPSNKPNVVRKTNRNGRFSYSIDASRVEWKLTPSNLASSW